MDEPSPLSMPFEEWVKLLPKVKLSEMTYIEKLAFIRDACYDIAYDMISGQFQDQMNDKWYGTVLAVMKDCGFDTGPIENVDWNNISEIVPGINNICGEVEKILIPIPQDEWGRTIYPENIILDN